MMVCIDISELYRVDFVSGIQRVVIEVTMRWLQENKQVRLLVFDTKRKKYIIVDNHKYLAFYQGETEQKNYLSKRYMEISDFDDTCVFFDLDSAWMNTMKRSYLLPLLKKQGCRIVAHFYDIIPITEPQYCHEHTIAMFMEYVAAHLDNDDFYITNAYATKMAIQSLVSENTKEEIPCQVVRLGSDLKVSHSAGVIRKKIQTIMDDRPYFLMVGTMEPRKNHKYVLDAFDSKLFDMGLKLVIVGRQGWNIDDLIDRIESHPLYGQQLFWINDATDYEVKALYREAYGVLFASYNEGFGLPIIEALKMGTPVFAADKEVLKEVGGTYCEYFSLKDIDSLNSLLISYLSDDGRYARMKQRISEFEITTWDSCAAEMFNSLGNLFKSN